MRVIMTRGLPASGKSTWAREFVKSNPTFRRWSNDEYQLMVVAVPFGGISARELGHARGLFFQHTSNFGFDLLVDNTNLNPYTVDEVRRHVKPDATIEVVEFPTPAEECVRRDGARPESVGADVINTMADKWRSRYDWI